MRRIERRQTAGFEYTRVLAQNEKKKRAQAHALGYRNGDKKVINSIAYAHLLQNGYSRRRSTICAVELQHASQTKNIS